MILKELLLRKAGRIVSLGPDATVNDVTRLMRAENVGAVMIVHADGSRAGIISEKEIVAAVDRHGPVLAKHAARDIMIQNPPVSTANEKVHNLAASMTRQRIRHMPVVDGGRLIGLLSIGDVLASRLEE